MLTVLREITSKQASPTKKTIIQVNQFLDYASTQEEAVVKYTKSDMVLHAHRDASYLSKPKAQSCVDRHHFLGSNHNNCQNNRPVNTVSTILKQVMASEAEAEISTLFINARTSLTAQQTLKELRHQQLKTPIQTDNTTAEGFVNNNIIPKATKFINMK